MDAQRWTIIPCFALILEAILNRVSFVKYSIENIALELTTVSDYLNICM